MRKRKTLRFRRRRELEGIEQFAAFYAELMDERWAAASGAIDALLQQTPMDRFPELVENPILRTSGAMEHVGKIFIDVLAKDPQKAKVIAELEVSLAESLPEGRYHRSTIVQTRAYAWRDLGMALRTLGHLTQSLEAFLAADRELAPHSALVHDRAVVHLSAAMTLQELERFDEAQALLAESRSVFLDHGDDKRVVLATITEGVLLQRLRHYREAREIYLLLLNSNHDIELEVLASIHRAIGFASIELGDYAGAEASLGRAIQLSQQIAQPVELTRSQWAFGRLLTRRGDTEKAIIYLRPIRRQLLRYGFTEEAGLCGLDVVEGMLALGNYSAAETLSRTIISEFMKAGLSQRAITALGYLQEAIASSGASATLVTDVREYIVSLRTSPERDFVHPSLRARHREP